MLFRSLGTSEGSQFRSPLGVAVIGGVITSTLLTLLVIPTFYEILFEFREKVFGRLGPSHAPVNPAVALAEDHGQ